MKSLTCQIKKMFSKVGLKLRGDGDGDFRIAGFTMIELLVVISVIGILAVAVLSSINPIEQINKGRDTRTRSDAAQLINAADRYFAIQEYYPWNFTVVGGYQSNDIDYESEFTFVGGQVGLTGETDWDWVDDLVTTAEVKLGYTTRIKNDDNIIVYKEGLSNATMYACFLPTSQAFKREAVENCDSGVTVDPLGTVDSCPSNPAVLEEDNWICLP